MCNGVPERHQVHVEIVEMNVVEFEGQLLEGNVGDATTCYGRSRF